MKTKLLALVLLAGGSAMFAQTRFSVGVNIGGGYAPGYYAPVPMQVVRPPYPGPGFVWVDGYWNPNRFGRAWVPGRWSRPYGYHVAPRYIAPSYSNGYNRSNNNVQRYDS